MTTPTITQALKPCPFCGTGMDVDPNDPPPRPSKRSPNDWFVWCEWCDTEGPHRATREEAIAAWNQRAVADSETPPGDHQAALSSVDERQTVERYDDRVRPLLLAQAAKRDAYEWTFEDAEQVIASLLEKLDTTPAKDPTT